MRGHYWTLAPFLSALVRPPVPPPARHFTTWVDDPLRGRVRLTGRLSERPATDALVLVVHGLGGSSQSPYAVEAARAAHAAGLASLRLDLRGADRRGEDFYHAGLTADLHAALAAPSLARYRRLYALGYSLGGHVCLRLAFEAHDPRLVAVAAVCAPLDLRRSAEAIDRAARAPYRRHVLAGLKEVYAEVHARGRPVPITLERARRIATLREWDDAIVAPRHGFRSALDYWERESVAPRLSGSPRPRVLVVAARRDPMVPADTIEPVLAGARVHTRWIERGGHVGFPRDLDLGEPGPRGLAPQVLSWLAGECDEASVSFDSLDR